MDNPGALLALGGFAAFLFFIICIALYMLFVIGLYGLAKTERTGNEWLAFIPILQFYAAQGIILVGLCIPEAAVFKLAGSCANKSMRF